MTTQAIEVKTPDDTYRPPALESTVSVSLAQFDKEAIAEYLRHLGFSVDKSTYVQIKKVYVYSTSGDEDDHDEVDFKDPIFSEGDLIQIEKLALCGQTHAAREMALEIVGEHIGRKLT
jgi:hypothetical protein